MSNTIMTEERFSRLIKFLEDTQGGYEGDYDDQRYYFEGWDDAIDLAMSAIKKIKEKNERIQIYVGR